MKEFAFKALQIVWAAFWTILLAPFLLPAFGIVKLLGGEPFGMDDMGFSFILTILIAMGYRSGSWCFRPWLFRIRNR